MRLSALIGTRNRPDALLRCVRSLRAQRRPPDEIVVLDDASEGLDVRSRLVAEGLDETAGVRVIRSKERLGVGRGRNLLFANAAGDACVVIDDDAWIEDPEFLGRVLTEFDARPSAAILAARIVDHRAEGDRLLVPFPRRARAADATLSDRAQCVSYFLGGAHAVRRQVFALVGGYDDAFVWGEEELDLAFRVVSAGFEIHYVPALTAHHQAEPAALRSDSQPDPELYFHVRNRFVLARKFLPAAYVIPYLATWLARHAVDAGRDGDLAAYVRGIRAGLAAWNRTPRTPLQRKALSYFARNHGRLWY